jgi:hypothetical protein
LQELLAASGTASQLAFAFSVAALVVHKLIACVGIVNMLLLRDRLYTYGV